MPFMRTIRSGRLAVLLALILALVLGAAAPAGAADNVTFCLSWVPYGKFFGFFAAREKGFYKESGIDVNIIRGFSAADNFRRLEAGACTFADAGLNVMVLARARGAKVKAVGVWHDKGMDVIIARKDRGIRTLKDLEGKSIATAADEDSKLYFPLLAEANNVDAGKVKWVTMEPASKHPALLAGSVDAIVTFVTLIPQIEVPAAQRGIEVVNFIYGDYGLDVYNNGITTTERLINENPDLVRRFTQATYKGLAWAVENPEEAAEIFLKLYPETNRALAPAHWKIAVDHMLTPTALKLGLGHISRERMELTRDVTIKVFDLKVKEPVEVLYTNDFLPKLFPKRK